MRAVVLPFALALLALAPLGPSRAFAQDTPAEPPPVEHDAAPAPAPDAQPPAEPGETGEPPATTAEGVHYSGAHPLDDGGYCYETGPHVHAAAPTESLAASYREAEGALHFVGDPVPFGYEGNVVGYESVHPIVVPVASYCYFVGFHYHTFAPDPVWAAWYAFFNGAWKFRGPVTVAYERDRPRYDRKAPKVETLRGFTKVARLARRFYTPAARTRLAHAGGRLALRLQGRGSARSVRATFVPPRGATLRGSAPSRSSAPRSQPSPRSGPSSR